MPKAKSSTLKTFWKKENPTHIFILLFILLVMICTTIFVFHWQSSIHPASAYCTSPSCGGGGTNNCANTRSGYGWYCGADAHGNGTPPYPYSSPNSLYKCNQYHQQIGELYCNSGCYWNPYGWDKCNGGWPPDY